MDIQVFEERESFTQEGEVWVRVLSNEIVDWPQVMAGLAAEQAALLDTVDLAGGQYHPELAPQGGFAFEDWWTFRQRKG